MRTLQFAVLLGLALFVSEIPLVGLPLKWVETFFHEISHGLATLATGGAIAHYELHYDGSGVCYSSGGWPPVVAFAGYAGASLWGLAMFSVATAASRTAEAIPAVAFGAAVALCAVLWGRGVDTMVISAVIVGVFIVAAAAGRLGLARLALAFVAVSVALSAIRAPLVLLVVGGQSDARSLADMTFIPRLVWVALWAALAVFVVFRMWRSARRRPLLQRRAA